MLGLFTRAKTKPRDEAPPALVTASGAPLAPAPLRTVLETTMKWAEERAFRSQMCDAAGDPEEARALLGDAGEILSQIGGPRRPQSAGEVYEWCGAKRAGEV